MPINLEDLTDALEAERASDPTLNAVPATPDRSDLREATTRWVHELDLNGPAVRRRLISELGVDVPQVTVSRWVRMARLTAPPPTLQNVSDRALRLVSSEIKRLEAQPLVKLDLDRLQKATAILKMIQGLQPPKRNVQGPRTLADLNGSERETEGKT
jgi:hypothetical protein